MSVLGNFYSKIREGAASVVTRGVRETGVPGVSEVDGTVKVASVGSAVTAGTEGPAVTSETAMRFTAVFAAIRLRSENIASLPKSISRVTGKGRVADDKHPAGVVIRVRPNGYMNVFSFWEYLNRCLDGWGNAYALIERDGRGFPVALHPVHPREVTVSLKEGEKWFRVSAQDFRGVYSDGEMCHFFMLSNDGVKGVNPITYNADSIGLGMSATRYGKAFFASGGNVKAVLEAEGTVNQKVYERLKEQVRGNHQTVILEDGVKYKGVGIAPEAAQMLETKLFSIQDVARIFNVPPHMLAELSKANYSTIEQQNIQFGMYSLRPAVKRYEVELERKLFLEGEGYDVKFDLRGIMRGDTSARGQYYNLMMQNGAYSLNEVRVMEGMEPIEGGDVHMVPLNMIPLEQLGKDGSNEVKK